MLLLSASGSAYAADPVPVGGPAGEHFTYNSALSDDFNGTSLDLSKWSTDFLQPTEWQPRWPAYNMPANNVVSGGCLTQVQKVGGLPSPTPVNSSGQRYQETTGFIMSTAATGYGYYEAKIQSAADNIVSGFWLDDPRTDSNTSDPNCNWEEIDIVCQRGTADPNTAVFFGHSAAGSRAGTDPNLNYASGSDLTAGYHVYGLSWTPTTLTWYFDGVARLQATNTYWHDPQYVMFDLESDPGYAGMPNTNLLPAAMSVDYFHYWAEAPEPSSWILLATGALGVAAYVWTVRRRTVVRPA